MITWACVAQGELDRLKVQPSGTPKTWRSAPIATFRLSCVLVNRAPESQVPSPPSIEETETQDVSVSEMDPESGWEHSAKHLEGAGSRPRRSAPKPVHDLGFPSRVTREGPPVVVHRFVGVMS